MCRGFHIVVMHVNYKEFSDNIVVKQFSAMYTIRQSHFTTISLVMIKDSVVTDYITLLSYWVFFVMTTHHDIHYDHRYTMDMYITSYVFTICMLY